MVDKREELTLVRNAWVSFKFPKFVEGPRPFWERCWEWGHGKGEQWGGRAGAREESMCASLLVIRRFELRKKLIRNETFD